MEKLIGYMLTWTTYGTWLEGDRRGYVKDGEVLPGDESREKLGRSKQKDKVVKLAKRYRAVINEAILNESKRLGQKVYCLVICSNHVHLVVNKIDENIGKVAGRYKQAGTRAMRAEGVEGKIWTKGFDKRYCYSEEELGNKIRYVEGHEE
jgi:REP element-mobilizing transposase RayT